MNRVLKLNRKEQCEIRFREERSLTPVLRDLNYLERKMIKVKTALRAYA